MRIRFLTRATRNRMLNKSFLYRAIQVLTREDRFKLGIVVVIQSLSGLLDLAGVAIFGVLGALAISGLESGQPGNRVNAVLKLIGLQNYSLEFQALTLGIAATALLIARTVFSVYFTKKTLHFLSRRGARISAHLVSQLLAQPLTRIQEKSVQDTVYALAHGVNVVTIGIVGTAVTMVSDFSLLMVMGMGLFLVDPGIAIATLLVFFVIGYSLHSLMHKKAINLGQDNARLSIESNETIVEVLSSYREAFVRNRRSFYVNKIEKLRYELAGTVAEMQFMPNVSKYVVETTVLFGAMSIAGVQFWLKDATQAVGTLAIFLAAGTRIAPAVLRIQQGMIQLRTNMGTAEPTLKLIEEFEYLGTSDLQGTFTGKNSDEFSGLIDVRNLDFTYPNNLECTIRNVSISIEQGEFVALVGGSGAGKTTLVDLILGVLNPDSGSVLISGVNPETAFETWPGVIGYVPQDTFVANGSIRENVALGFEPSIFSDSEIWNVLRIAQLEDVVANLPESLDTYIGDRGTRLSGGQRQRLGIARALLTNPKILFLDEATSSLDAETEDALTKAINNLKGEVTFVVIAHRLATIKNADTILYLMNGEIIERGNFEELKATVPSFAIQAQLMGL